MKTKCVIVRSFYIHTSLFRMTNRFCHKTPHDHLKQMWSRTHTLTGIPPLNEFRCLDRLSQGGDFGHRCTRVGGMRFVYITYYY